MTTKIGRLGHPRIAIALVWFLPANSSAGTAPDGAPPEPEPEPIPPEEIEFVRAMTGMEPDELISRLRGIADRFREDPATMRRELVRLADGDEITAEEIMRIIRAAEAGNDNGDDDREETTGEGAEILDFERPDDDGSPDDGGQP
jgi:DNA-binding transcriptional ArsR family regulator